MDDLISEFITETSESIALLDTELVTLEQNPEDEAILSNIFRVMHTIKGTCGFLGLPRLEGVAHAGENVLGKIRDKEMEATPDAISLILESIDSIKDLLDYLSDNGEEPEGNDEELKAKLNHFAETGRVGSDVPAAAPANNGAGGGDVPAEIIAEAEKVESGEFSHFKGDDDPEMAAAIEKLMAEQNAAAGESPATEAEVKAEEPIVAEEPAAAAPTPPAPKAKPVAPKPVASAKKAPDKKPATKESAGGSAPETNQTIRVNLNVLEGLMQTVSELVLTRNQLMQIVRTRDDKEFMTPLQQLSHITSELQDNVMQTRMQPIGNAWSKFPRLIRDLSMEVGKKIELKMLGADTELDRQLLEVIKDPLTHMVRNSCDHGLETPEERLAAGKDEKGTVTLSAYHEGGHIIIDIIDDGRGINLDRVKEKALANGVATQAELDEMDDKQIAQFVFAAGFSTAEKVTAVSGRGVGMDVVRTNIQKIGGAIDLESTWGEGSKVSIKIPLTLAIVSVLLVESNGQKFGIPQINVLELVQISPKGKLSMEMINDSLVLRLRDKLLPLGILSKMLETEYDIEELKAKDMCVAVCRVGSNDFGVLVDRVYDTEEIVVKPVSKIMKSLDLYSGNTILGDGSVIMILDPNGMAKSMANGAVSSRGEEVESKSAEKEHDERSIDFLLFSVDDVSPKAVPLELVSRLEEVDVKSIEIADNNPVVQYRGDLMRLVTLSKDFVMPNEGSIEVVVFSYDKRVVGLLVKEIIDIVRAPFEIKTVSNNAKDHGYLGSMVIEEKTTDIVDVAQLFSEIVKEADENDKTLVKNEGQECDLLLVEDSPFFRNMTAPFLTTMGYQVTTADDAAMALEILANKKFDMIITDIEMPGMDGFDFASECRKDTSNVNGTPIIAYTSTLNDGVVKKSENAGMQDCIAKTDRPGLLESVARCLKEKQEVAA